MVKTIKDFLSTLDEERIMTKREFFLTLTTCTLAGILFGILVSPKKKMMIGSHNGCNSGNGQNIPTDKNTDENIFEDDFWEA